MRRLALLTLLGALCACDAPPRDAQPARPVARDKAPAPAPSNEQRAERSGQCEQMARDRFRRDWQDGTARSADGKMTAAFTSHYNAKLDACFYLLTLSQSANAADTVRKMLFDIDTAELYGEYLGPAADGSPADGFPATCRLEALHCGSRREWEVLLERYMRD